MRNKLTPVPFLVALFVMLGCSVSPARDADPSVRENRMGDGTLRDTTPTPAITRHPVPRVELLKPPSGKPWVYVMPTIEKHLLPYVEAEGIADSWPIFWISNTEVAFTVRKAYTFGLPEGLRRLIRGGNLSDYWRDDRAKWHEVHILDIHTGKSRFHSDGSFVGYKDGIATIVLEHYSKRNPVPKEPVEQKEYNVMLVGPVGKEERVTRPATPNPVVNPRKCPGEPDEVPPGARLLLKPEHGCLQGARLDAPPGIPLIYYRSDGKRVELRATRDDLPSSPKWIEWLGAYQLNNYRIKGQVDNEVALDTINFMKPDGSLLPAPLKILANMGGTISPTRAGIIGFYSRARTPEDDGIHLQRGSKLLQISEGDVYRRLAVSPDGCKVAYQSALREIVHSSPKPETYRLRVIDVCRAFNLPPDTIPFVW